MGDRDGESYRVTRRDPWGDYVERRAALRLAIESLGSAPAGDLIERAEAFRGFLTAATPAPSECPASTEASQGIPPRPKGCSGDDNMPSQGSLRSLSERLVDVHLKFERCRLLGLPFPNWSDL